MSISRRDFVAIAEAIRQARELSGPNGNFATANIALSIADHCASVNDEFDRGRFLRAAGIATPLKLGGAA